MRASTRRRAAALALAALGGMASAGCGIRATSVPVDAGAGPTRVSCAVPDGPRTSPSPSSSPSVAPPAAPSVSPSVSPSASGSASPTAVPSAAATTVTVRIYLVCSQRVSPVPRTLPGPLTDRLLARLCDILGRPVFAGWYPDARRLERLQQLGAHGCAVRR